MKVMHININEMQLLLFQMKNGKTKQNRQLLLKCIQKKNVNLYLFFIKNWGMKNVYINK